MASGVVSTQKRQENFWEEQLNLLEIEKNKELKGFSKVTNMAEHKIYAATPVT